ncbi:MAG: glycosyltransferase [Muribaculum sp.]|nr:glycosyltransferase [Muribaculum sp.]
MKSVLFVIPTLGGGGAEKVLVNLVNNLDKSKYDIEILTLFKNDTNLKFLKNDIRVTSCLKKQFKGNRIIFKLFSPKFLYKRLIHKRYDIVVSYLEGPGERIVSGCPFTDSKLVNWIHVEQHTLDVAASSYRSVKEFKDCLDKFDCTVAVSETVKQDFENITQVSHDFRVIYNTLEVDKIRKLAQKEVNIKFEPSSVNIFSIGRLTKAKGFDRLIKAHSRLRAEGYNLNLYILGNGELLDELKNLTNDSKVSDSVHFLGFHSNPYKFLNHADLFVCSSQREGFSTAVSEALILGVPVVSTNCSGTYELLGNNNEYGIVTENSEEGVYAGLKEILRNKDIISHYRDASERRGKKFSTQATVKAVEDLFDSL